MDITRPVSVTLDLSLDELAGELAALTDTEIGQFLDILASKLRDKAGSKHSIYCDIMLEISKNLTDDGITFIDSISEFLHDSCDENTTYYH